MDAVQAPIIPIVGELIRTTPGTISLGQGMVSWGPPPEAIEAAHRRRGRLGDAPVRRRRRRFTAARGPGTQASRRKRSRSDWQPRTRHRRQQHGVSIRRSGDLTAGRRDRVAGALLLQSRDGRPDCWLQAGDRTDRSLVPARSGSPDCRDHASHTRDRHGIAEQSNGRRLSRRRAARSQPVRARRAASSTSPTRRTSTSPTKAHGTSHPDRCPAPARTRSRSTRSRKRTDSPGGAWATPLSRWPSTRRSTRCKTPCSSARRLCARPRRPPR